MHGMTVRAEELGTVFTEPMNSDIKALILVAGIAIRVDKLVTGSMARVQVVSHSAKDKKVLESFLDYFHNLVDVMHCEMIDNDQKLIRSDRSIFLFSDKKFQGMLCRT